MVFVAVLLSLFVSEIPGMKVIDVHDGDTVKFKTKEGFEVKTRLLGIDCPEVAQKNHRGRKATPGQALGDEARERTKQLLEQAVAVNANGTDMYSRSLAEISLQDGRLLNEVLVEEGFCEAYLFKGKPISERYLQAEKKAKEAKRGIWSLKSYESPSRYRKRVSGPK